MQIEVLVADGLGRLKPAVVSCEDGHRVRDLADAIGDHLGVTLDEVHLVTPWGHTQLAVDLPLAQAAIPRGAIVASRPRTSGSDRLMLAVIGGPDAGRLLPLGDGELVIGRSPEVDLQVLDAFVSRRHAALTIAGDDVSVEDLGSANGTVVSGRAASEPMTVGRAPLELGSTLLAVRRQDASGAPAVGPHGRVLVESRPLTVRLPDQVRVPAEGDGDPAQWSGAAAVDAAERLSTALPDLATLRRAAVDREPPLWSRAAPLSALRMGWGPLGVRFEPDGVEVLVHASPVAVDLADGPVVVTGDPATAIGAASALLLQAACLYPPERLAIGVVAAPGDEDAFRFVPWLPHADGRRRGAGLHLGAGDGVAALREVTSRRDQELLLVVDRAVRGVDAMLGPLAGAGGVHVVGIGGNDAAWASSRVELRDEGSVVVQSPGGIVAGMGADGVAPDVALEIALALAPLVTTEPAPHVGAAAPQVADLVPVTTADGVATTWAAGRPRAAAVGIGTGGIATVPLDAAPVIVRGSPVSGARHAAALLVLTSAATVGPDRLGVVFASVPDARLGDLPHVLPSPGGADQALAEVVAEIGRRRELVARRGVASWGELRRADPDAPPPLLVVIETPAGDEDLVRLLDEGPTAGVHALLLVKEPAESPAGDAIVLDVRGSTCTVTMEGHAVEVTMGDLSGTIEAADRLTITSLRADGRPADHGRTSLARTPAQVDPVRALVTACRDAAVGQPGPVWSPAVDRSEPATVRRTFVFTDIVGSTRLLEAIGDRAWADLVSWHDRTLRESFSAHRGDEVDHAGDGFLVAFESAADAVTCAVDIQRRLDEHRTGAGFAPRVRIGGHVADVLDADGYKGHGLHVAARIGALADADEIVFSSETLADAPDVARVVQVRRVAVKGVTEPVEIAFLDWR